jgi:hypothetical protein
VRIERTNAILRSYGVEPAETLAPELARYVDGGFCEVNGWIVWAVEAEDAVRHTPFSDVKVQSTESSLNHVHLDDLLPEPWTTELMISQGITFARCTADALERAYPEVSFEVTLGYNDKELHREWDESLGLYDPDEPFWVQANVRFTTTRDYAAHSDPDGFKWDGILQIELAPA